MLTDAFLKIAADRGGHRRRSPSPIAKAPKPGCKSAEACRAFRRTDERLPEASSDKKEYASRQGGKAAKLRCMEENKEARHLKR